MLAHKWISAERRPSLERDVYRRAIWGLLLAVCLVNIGGQTGISTIGNVTGQSASDVAAPIVSQDQKQPYLSKRPRSRNRRPMRRPDVIYYPTPDETVAEMLRLANIKPGDVLYDLGSGDGRIPIMAAERFGIRAVGIEIDPQLVTVAQKKAQQAHVAQLVSFRNADMFRTNLGEATVVTLYLSNRLNLLLRPKLLKELRPGSRIVSHDFHMGDWTPEEKIRVPWRNNLYRTVYLWTVPARGVRRKTTRH